MPRIIEQFTPTPSVLDDLPEPADQRDPYERRVRMAEDALGRMAEERALLLARMDRFERGGLAVQAAQARDRLERLEREEAEMGEALAIARRDWQARQDGNGNDHGQGDAA